MQCKCKYIELYRGDDSDFEYNQRVELVIVTDLDLSGFSAHFSLLGYQQDFGEIPADKTLPLVFPSSVTSKYPLGMSNGTLWLNDTEGRRRTVSNAVHFLVTNNVEDAYGEGDAQSIRLGIIGIGSYDSLTNKPSINGVTLEGDKTGAALGLADDSDIEYLSREVSRVEGKADAAARAASGAQETAQSALDGLSGKKDKQTPVLSPSASGEETSYIDTISQDANGVITPTKKSIPSAAPSTSGAGGKAGLMSASDKEKLDGIAAGATNVAVDSTLTVEGDAADAKAVGDALRGGFTEWVCDEISDGWTFVSCEWDTVLEIGTGWFATLGNGSITISVFLGGNADSVNLEKEAQGNNPGVELSRHLITPTKTSQLTNDGAPNGGGVPYATTAALDGKRDVLDLGVRGPEAGVNSWFVVNGTVLLTDSEGWAGGAFKIEPDLDHLGRYTLYIENVEEQSYDEVGSFELDANYSAVVQSYHIASCVDNLAKESQIPSVPEAYTHVPSMDGVGSAGSSGAWARGDHVHPHDTSKANASDIPYSLVATVEDWSFSGSGYDPTAEYDVEIFEPIFGEYTYALKKNGVVVESLNGQSEENPTQIVFPEAGVTATRAKILLDRAVNSVTASTATTLALPDLVSGKSRDFYLKLAVTGSQQISFSPSSGITYTGYGNPSKTYADGTYLLRFTETAENVFNVTNSLAATGSYNDLTEKPTIPTVPGAYTGTPAMDGVGSAGSSTAWARGDHVHPSDTSKLDGAAAYPAWVSHDYEPPVIVSHKGRLWSCLNYTIAEPGEEESQSDWQEVTIEDLKQDALSPSQLDAASSGATAEKVQTWDGYAALISAKVSTNALDGQTYDFSRNYDIVRATADIVQLLGGTVTNNPTTQGGN